MHIERLGDSGPRLLLVHGSIAPGWATWSAQRELAEEGYRLVVPHRSGYPPNPPLDLIDFEVQAREIADLIEPGTHVVGHSYGGVVSLLACGLVPLRVRSLTVIEPPALGLARGNPAVEAVIAQVMAIRDNPGTLREAFARFVAAVGSSAKVPETLTPAQEASIRATLAERPPFEAVFDWASLRSGGFPVLVVSGKHDPAYEAICDVIAGELAAERAVIPGAAHSVQRTGAAFNRRLRAHVDAAEANAPGMASRPGPPA
jgi:pimeloyl-ACP methyl ester carboxylesterase